MAKEEGLNPQMTTPTKIDEDSVSFRRNSTGKKVSSSSSEKVVPHYLRASTGSCHDLCKYGHKNSTEEKPRRPTPRRATAKPTDSQVSAETVASLGKKKKKNNSPYMTRSLESLNYSASVDSDVRGERKKTPLVKVKAEVSSKPLRERVSASNERLGLGVSLKKEKSSSEKRPVSQNVTKSPTIVTTSRAASTKVSPRPALNRVTSLNRNQNGSKKVVAPLRSRPDEVVEEPEPTNSEGFEVEEKIVYVVKTKARDSVASDLDQTESCSQEDEEKIVYVVETEAKDNTFDLDETESYVIKMENGNAALELNQKVEYIEEKASELEESEDCARGFECVDKAEPENNASESNPSLFSDHPSSSEYTLSESEADSCLENSESEGIENSESQDRNDKARKGSGLASAEDEDEKARKMRFRRGTVLEIQPEDNAPRRLRFRRGKVLDDQDVGSDGRRRRYKRREIGREVSENGAEIVVLKHQDVQGKKDTQGLFNNVIEETASKLVETRKSKVKALVGAFETVISLQDGKPSSNTAG